MRCGTSACAPNSVVNSANRAGVERLQHAAHLRAHRQLLARHEMMPVDPRARNESRPGGAQVLGRDVRQARQRDPLEPHANRREIAIGERQRVELARGLLHPLVLEQPADELGARVFALLARRRRAASAAAAAT